MSTRENVSISFAKVTSCESEPSCISDTYPVRIYTLELLQPLKKFTRNTVCRSLIIVNWVFIALRGMLNETNR